MIASQVIATLPFLAVFVLISHSVPPSRLGLANGVAVLVLLCVCAVCQRVVPGSAGLGQSLAALARSFGPAAGGAMWSVSARMDVAGHQFLVCVLAHARTHVRAPHALPSTGVARQVWALQSGIAAALLVLSYWLPSSLENQKAEEDASVGPAATPEIGDVQA